MAQQGFDPSFGLRGTCASEVSGFGGWPLGVFVGIDGRPTIVCRATSQKKVDHDDVGHASRFQKPQFSTLRVVSFPADGRPVPIGSDSRRTAIFGPDPTADTSAIRAIVSADGDRIAVLGYIIRANREVPTLSIFSAGTIQNGVAPWTLSRTVELTALSGINVRQYGMGWSGGDVIVVASQFVPAGVELLIYTDKTQRTATVDFPRPKLDLPKNFNVNLRVGGVSFVKPDRLFVGMTWEGVDPNIPGIRPRGVIDQGRASMISLRQKRNTFRIDSNFGARGIWLATLADGEITTSDYLVVDSAGRPSIGGRAERATATSLFAASLDPTSGDVLWTSYPGAGVLARPAGMTAGLGDNLLLCGTTRDWDTNAPSDPGDAVAIRLLPTGQPDGGFGVKGVVRFRLHGGTHPTACAETSAGETLVASIVPWGWEAAATSVQPCLSRLTAAGDLDPAFGSAGLCRHDGLGSAEVIAVGPAGGVWSAGVAQQFLGAGNNPQFLKILTVALCNAGGELESTFGLNGIATFQLPQWDDLEVTAIVPLANGRVVLNGTATLHGVTPPTGGSWLLRLQSNGQIDTTFGGGRRPNGMRFYPGRGIVLLSELTSGSLQGFESGAVVTVVTVGSNGTPVTLTTVSKPLVNVPSILEPNGDFYGLTHGKVTNPYEVGLVRFRNGAIDTMFGAGGAQSSSTPGNPDARFVNLLSLGVQARPDQKLVGGDQTIALTDGTLLTLWTLAEEESVFVFGRPDGIHLTDSLLLLAWAADGNPRVVPAWGRPGKVIKHPAGAIKNWLGWSYQCAALQPDGSIVVCLAGDDNDAAPAYGRPAPPIISQSPYFCRLIPPNFDLDPAFGGAARFLAQRAPGCDFVLPQTDPNLIPGTAENQVPVSVKRMANDAVVAAIRCRHPSPVLGTELEVPNLPLDGSVGIARLV